MTSDHKPCGLIAGQPNQRLGAIWVKAFGALPDWHEVGVCNVLLKQFMHEAADRYAHYSESCENFVIFLCAEDEESQRFFRQHTFIKRRFATGGHVRNGMVCMWHNREQAGWINTLLNARKRICAR